MIEKVDLVLQCESVVKILKKGRNPSVEKFSTV